MSERLERIVRRKRKKVGRVKFVHRAVMGIVGSILALVFSFVMLFRVTEIVVTGNEVYSDEKIKALVIDEESYNNSLLFCLFNDVLYFTDLPFLESISVTYVDRNTILLEAVEKQTLGMFTVDDQTYCLLEDGTALDASEYDEDTLSALVTIYNLCSEATAGEMIDIDDDSVLEALSTLTSSLSDYEIEADGIYIEDETVKTYTLGIDNVQVLLGQDEYLEEKIRRLSAILPHLDGMTGTLHLENYDEDTENIIFDTNDIADFVDTDALDDETADDAVDEATSDAEE